MKSKIHEGSKLRAKTFSKKLFLLVTAIALCSIASAQINKGRMMLGGSFNTQSFKNLSKDTSYLAERTQTNKNSNKTVSLRYGYFLADGFMLGILGGINNAYYENKNVIDSQGSTTTNLSKQTSNGFSAGIFSRYYKMIGTSRFAIFGELAASYGGGKTKNSSETNGVTLPNYDKESKFTNINVVIRPGLTYFFTKNIAAEAFFGNVGYFHTKTEENGSSNTTTNSGFNSRLDFSLSNVSLGINFYFGGKS